MWNPDVYPAFADHRGRPFFDLLSRVGAEIPRRVVDLGCGPGNLTVSLAERGPTPSSRRRTAHRRWSRRPASAASTPRRRCGGLDAAARHRRRGDQRGAAVGARHARAVGPLGGAVVRRVVDRGAGAGQLRRAVARSRARRSRGATMVADRCGTCRSGRARSSTAPATPILTDAGCPLDAWETTYVHELTGETPGSGLDHRHRANPVKEPLCERGSGSSSATSSSRCSTRRTRCAPTAPRSSRSGGCSWWPGSAWRRWPCSSSTWRDELVDVGAGGVEHQIGVLGRFVRRVDAGEALEFAGARPRVQALGVPLLALGERRGHVTSMNGSFAASLSARAISRSDSAATPARPGRPRPRRRTAG